MHNLPGRNDPCWCGSEKKYKSCHAALDAKIAQYHAQGHQVPPHSILKTPQQLLGMRESSRINIAVLDFIIPYMVPGANTETLNQLIHEKTLSMGGVPAPLNYEGYPKSVCISINDVVCHGIPNEGTLLREGDIVNVDVSTLYEGYFSDSSRMFCIGTVSTKAAHLVKTALECVDLGIAQVRPWGFLGDVAHAVQTHAENNGYSVVREIGGHGIGLAFHEDPWVGYIGEPGTDMLLVPGMTFTVEPMINAGAADVVIDSEDDWTVYTADGSLSAQWEKTVLVTQDGCEIITY